MAARKGSAHHKAKLTEDDVLYFRELYAEGGVTFEQLAEAAQHRVCHTVIKDAVRGYTWKHVPGAIPVKGK
jgi:hypothetical protein